MSPAPGRRGPRRGHPRPRGSGPAPARAAAPARPPPARPRPARRRSAPRRPRRGTGRGACVGTVDVWAASILRRTASDSVGPKPARLAHGPSLPVPVRLRPPLYFLVPAPSFEIRTIVRIHMRPYDERLDHLLARAAKVFAERGYHSTTMRDLAAASGMSLAGMYYYVKGKEELLSLIEERCFTRVLDGARRAMPGDGDPLERLQAFIRHHVTFFAAHMPEMKVLSHEANSLTGERLRRVNVIKRGYVDLLEGLLKDAA